MKSLWIWMLEVLILSVTSPKFHYLVLFLCSHDHLHPDTLELEDLITLLLSVALTSSFFLADCIFLNCSSPKRLCLCYFTENMNYTWAPHAFLGDLFFKSFHWVSNYLISHIYKYLGKFLCARSWNFRFSVTPHQFSCRFLVDWLSTYYLP